MREKIVIFGYGSLLSEDSFKKSVKSAKMLFPAKLYGFVRTFNFPSPNRLSEINGTPCAVLNIEKSEFNQRVNGVCFEVDREDFEELLIREEGYELVQIEVVNFNDESKKFRAFTFMSSHFKTHNFQMDSEKQWEYLEICLRGAKLQGQEFLDDFLNTTYIGRKTLKEVSEVRNRLKIK